MTRDEAKEKIKAIVQEYAKIEVDMIREDIKNGIVRGLDGHTPKYEKLKLEMEEKIKTIIAMIIEE